MDDTLIKASPNNDPYIILKVKKFQLSGAKHFGTVGGYHLGLIFMIMPITQANRGHFLRNW